MHNAECTHLDPAATCSAGFCRLGDDPYVRTDFAPFTRGPAIGNYADYDDWRSVQFQVCEALLTEPRLPGAPAAYCGPAPAWDEPFGAAPTAPPPLNDRIVNPHRYAR